MASVSEYVIDYHYKGVTYTVYFNEESCPHSSGNPDLDDYRADIVAVLDEAYEEVELEGELMYRIQEYCDDIVSDRIDGWDEDELDSYED